MTTSRKILLAEDNEINRKLAEMLFRRLEGVFDFAMDGQEALDKASESEYDMILMDIEMPGLNGVESARAIKEKLGDRAPIIVALTAHASDDNGQEFLDQGMDDYLTKPLKSDSVTNLLAKWL